MDRVTNREHHQQNRIDSKYPGKHEAPVFDPVANRAERKDETGQHDEKPDARVALDNDSNDRIAGVRPMAFWGERDAICELRSEHMKAVIEQDEERGETAQLIYRRDVRSVGASGHLCAYYTRRRISHTQHFYQETLWSDCRASRRGPEPDAAIGLPLRRPVAARQCRTSVPASDHSWWGTLMRRQHKTLNSGDPPSGGRTLDDVDRHLHVVG